ncbi:MAG: ABC transporter substrate-binding protein [Chloroflexota bacterium]|nr:ABC transporter substrate-binding protein [Chloroflexota bacterium]
MDGTNAKLGPEMARDWLLRHRMNRRQMLVSSAAAGLGTMAGLPRRASAQTATPTAGGRAVIALIQEPGQMNPYFNGQSGSFLSVLACDPLFTADAAGNYLPVLAAEVPSVENGGISEDFLTITYTLRDGILWSDGEPLTADDFVFSYEVYANPDSTPLLGAQYSFIDSVEAIDPLTFQVRMNGVNPGYLRLWDNGSPVQPMHRYESTAITQDDPLARMPLGTGAFVFTEWRTGDEIILDRNPNYRVAGQPYLDGITIRITPEKESAVASYLAGDFDTIYFFTTGDLQPLTQAELDGAPIEIALQEIPASTEWLWLNLSDQGDLGIPHPVLGDPAVREAMDHALDRQTVIDEVLGGFGFVIGSSIYTGFAAVDLPAAAYDPERANALMEEAGWVAGGDGIREKDGVRASLRYQTIAGDQVRELYQQVVQQNLAEIGIEVLIENVPSNTIFGSWEEGGIFSRGDYDILMSRDGGDIDPSEFTPLFVSSQIPSEENPAGLNRVRYNSEEYDAAVADGESTLDQAERQEAYARAAEVFARDRPSIGLYASAWGWSWNERLQGVTTDNWDGMWPSSATWFVEG